MVQQIPVDPAAWTGFSGSKPTGEAARQVAPDIAYQRLLIVNVVFLGHAGAGDRHWVLVDAGVPGSASFILRAAEHRFGPRSRPAAILLTHSHFDHVGSLEDLASRWDAPIFAHPAEHPFLTGGLSHAPPDPSVGGGLMAMLSGLFPRGPIDVSPWLRCLPPDGHLPGMPEWAWVFTGGHSPGHVSFWRPRDRSLIVGDAFITTAQESAYAVATQQPEMHGPPKYYTPDWPEARRSVERLASLEPELVVTGHGPAMGGFAMREALHRLTDEFNDVAVPRTGRYVPSQDLMRR